MRPLYIIAALLAVVADVKSDIVFSWTNCPNWQAGSPTYLWQGTSRPLHYSKRFVIQSNPTNSAVLSESALSEGFNYFSIQQQATNRDGSVGMTDFSGEVQVLKQPVFTVEMPIMTSTNLGQTWVEATNQQVTFPTSDWQRYFRAGQMRLNRGNKVSFPPSP